MGVFLFPFLQNSRFTYGRVLLVSQTKAFIKCNLVKLVAVLTDLFFHIFVYFCQLNHYRHRYAHGRLGVHFTRTIRISPHDFPDAQKNSPAPAVHHSP